MKKAIAALFAFLLLSFSGFALAAESAADVTIVKTAMLAGQSALINPLYCQYRDIQSMNQLVFESVIELDSSMKPTALLADRWTVSGKKWTFYLRSGVTFHDGSPLTALDVVMTYQKIKQLGSAYPYYARVTNYISDMTATDELTLVVTAKTNTYMLLYAMTFPVLQRDSVSASLPMGTGPFWYVAYEAGEELRLEANPLWWKKRGTVQTVVAYRYDTTADALTALQSGSINTMTTRSISAALSRNLKGRTSVDYSTTTYECILPNLNDELLSNLNMRKALMYAIDRSSLANNVYLGMVQESEVPIVPGSWLYEPQSAIYNYSPERALKMLYDMGWYDYDKDNYLDRIVDQTLHRFTLEILTYNESVAPTRGNAATAIAKQLDKIGIECTVTVLTQSKVKERIKNGEYQLALVAFNLSEVPDLAPLLATDGSLNVANYANKDMDELLSAVKLAGTENELKTLVSQVQMKMVNDLPVMGLFFRTGTVISTLNLDTLSGLRESAPYHGIERVGQ